MNICKHTTWQLIERIVFLVGLAVIAMDMLWWRPG